jgi:hypothetical protein
MDKYEQATYAAESRKARYAPDGLSMDYLIDVQRKAFLEFFIRFSQIMLCLRSIRSIEDVRRFGIMAFAAVVLVLRTARGRIPLFRKAQR